MTPSRTSLLLASGAWAATALFLAPPVPARPADPRLDDLVRRSPFMPAAGESPIARGENTSVSEFEYRGYYESGGDRRHGIRHVPSGDAAWLGQGDAFHGLIVLQAMEDGRAIRVSLSDAESVLSLPRARTGATAPEQTAAPVIVGPHSPPRDAASARARQSLAMTARTTPLPATVRVAPLPLSDGANDLAGNRPPPAAPEAEKTETAAETAAPASPGYALRMGRGFNRVNSRIYASDHIAEHGEPAPVR